ncbi:MAG: anaerobic glycerol-3-phosphate dehydrogenase subunit C [Deltaproteobacteria bacterium]|nr:anaerobic glycerol-3-phosphate dehydrogenase subunit C [Deltaproteobacteria bacterium]MBW2122835.1 anaerobic glycerol-3-phosphate dehydrogenase subunit C [Deltaproteobacteria bacterium]
MKQKTPVADRSDQCIKCGICTEYCPVARVTGDFLGSKQAGPDAQRFRRPQDRSADPWVSLCIGCGKCDLVCPAGVNVSDLTLMAKAKLAGEKGFSPRDWLLGHTHLFGSAAVSLASLTNMVLRSRLFRGVSDRLLAIDRRRPLPGYEKETFRGWFRSHRSKGQRKVAYFYGCYANTNEIDVAIAVVEVLEKNGFEVVLPYQECCGMPSLGQGDLESARALGERNVRSLARVVDEGYDIVFSSATCGHMIRSEYPEFFRIEGAQRVAERIFDVSEYLLMLHERGELNTDFEPLKDRLPYHAPCHLRSLGIGLPAIDLLQLIPGLELVDIDAGCCGLGGTYGFKKETYDISVAIGQNLVRALEEFGSSVVVSDCEGCRMQIRHLTGLDAVHPLQILRDAYRRGRA